MLHDATAVAGDPSPFEEDRPAPRWSNLLTFLPAPAAPPPAAGRSAGGPEIPLEERLVLAGEWLLPRLLAGRPATAHDVWEGVERFRAVYETANAVGTLLGRGVAGHGFDLYRRGGRFSACYENARKVVDKLAALAPDRLAAAAAAAGHPDPAALLEAVRNLPRY